MLARVALARSNCYPRNQRLGVSERRRDHICLVYASEGPGTGLRHPPGPADVATSRPSWERFPLYSAADMEELMPLWVHTSAPPEMESVDKEPAGRSAQHLPNGPGTGRRIRPAPAIPRRQERLLLPYPGKMDLKRDLIAKHRFH